VTRVRIGVIPLIDAAPILAAHELGLFAEQGLDVALSIEPSWATVRDKLAAGALDAAHLLAPLALASAVGIGPVAGRVVTALSLGLGGNAIAVAPPLAARLTGGAQAAAEALAHVVEERRSAGAAPLRFASVFPWSMHEYELRYWLASAGIVPQRDVRILVVPPPRMVEALEAGAIDGFCVGEPWSSVAVQRGCGAIVATKVELWRRAPEKVLGVREEWAERNADVHRALLRALLAAARWCDEPTHRPGLVRIVARWIGAPEAAIAPALLGRLVCAPEAPPLHVPDFLCFHRFDASFPWRSHAAWILVQMLRWGQIEKPIDVRAVAAAAYRCDLHREAAADLGMPTPSGDEKIEGAAPDRFLDGRRFDCGDVVAELADYAVHDRRVALDELAAAQSPARS
jgi:two-component system, oxyanion-binding sensor